MPRLYENRIIGPPGTGKTTTLAQYVRATVEKYGPDAVMVASFTKAAAAEIAGRDLPVEPSQVGTLHHFAYMALDHPPVAEEKISDWNKEQEAAGRPHFMLTPSKRDIDDMDEDPGFAAEGDDLYNRLDIYRARMTDRRTWDADVRGFAQVWEAWKRRVGVVDFTDMIEMALLATDEAPGSPRVGLFDESQDYTAIELALCRKWGSAMDTIFVVGDPQQCLYNFRGASPEAFYNPPVPKSQQKVLDQSYRLPRRVHALAQRWIAQESEPFDYKPRDYDGEVRFDDSLSFRFPETLLLDAAKYLELGKSVMFLTTCGYMLDNLRLLMLEQGLPFHNPYRRRQPAWNPLHPGRGVASKDRLLAYLRPDPGASDRPQLWSPDDLKLWTAVLKAEGTLRRGAKTALEGSGGGASCSDDFLEELFEAQSLARALDLDLDWLEQNLLASRRKGMEFPLKVARRWGARKLRDTPQTVVGTVHSTKGGQSDVVYLCPDLAVPAMEQWEAGGEGRHAIVRQMYVGITRARESLIITGPSSNLAVEIE